jgi:hypothetical protein
VPPVSQGCGSVYAKLEICLGENDRAWRKCQAGVELPRLSLRLFASDNSPPPFVNGKATYEYAFLCVTEVHALKECYAKAQAAASEDTKK